MDFVKYLKVELILTEEVYYHFRVAPSEKQKHFKYFSF